MNKEHYPSESLENKKETLAVAETLNFGRKLEKILNDPDVRALGPMAIRTSINLILSASELFPITAELVNAPTFVTDLVKVAKMAKAGKLVGLEKMDLTPDVTVKRAWFYQLMELPTFGFLPTHTIETLRQFRKGDLPKIKAALIALKQIVMNEKTRSDKNIAKEAADKFKK
ncbi:hypothetical protein KW791_03940 [Candidatus Parcubacteria bacterium]|nr:hypothetical protein [Candidatus Parcubacteria bacterium]